MKVFQKGNENIAGDEKLHCVRELVYDDGDGSRLMNPKVITWCDQKRPVDESKGDIYTEYERKEHKDIACQECKEAISRALRRKARSQAR